MLRRNGGLCLANAADNHAPCADNAAAVLTGAARVLVHEVEEEQIKETDVDEVPIELVEDVVEEGLE